MVTTTGRHTLAALTALAGLGEGEYLGAAPLARRVGAPANYLGKVLRSLCRSGLLESRKGAAGGFRLARDPRRLSLYDVLEPLERVSRWGGCFLGHDKCSDTEPCALHSRWKAVRKAYLDFLRRTTIADMAAREARRQ
jgi:Rrf2 family protein